MYCRNCGNYCADGDAYCQRCGAPQTPAPVPEYAPAPAYAEPRKPATAALVRAASSKLFLSAIITYCVSVAVELFSSVFGMGLGDVIDYLMFMTGAELPGETFGGGPSLLTYALSIVGLWLVYAYARKAEGRMKTGGFSVLRVQETITLVAICILCVAMPILVGVVEVRMIDEIAEIFGGGRDGRLGALVYSAVLIVAVIAVFVLLIVFYAKVLSALKNAARAARGEDAKKAPSLFIAVCIFIFIPFGFVIPAVVAVYNPWLASMLFIKQLISTAPSVLFAVVLIKYRSALVRAQNNEYVEYVG